MIKNKQVFSISSWVQYFKKHKLSTYLGTLIIVAISSTGAVYVLKNTSAAGHYAYSYSLCNPFDTNCKKYSAQAGVYRIYKGVFNREPDNDGATFWTNKLLTDTSLTSMASSFVNTSEWKTKYGGLSNGDFVRNTYEYLLLRQPDTSGYNFWVAQLNNGTKTRANLVASIADSSEAASTLYDGFTARFIDAPPPANEGTVSQNPADYTPHVISGNINQYQLVGTTMYAAGTISKVLSPHKSTSYPRHNIMAFNAKTGAVSSFAPNVDGQVWSMDATPDGHYLYLGGEFSSVDGVSREGVVKYDLVNNRVDTSFNAYLNSRATVVKLVHGQLIVAGSFTKVGAVSRTALASVNPNTGAVTSYMNVGIAGSLTPQPAAGPTRIYRFSINPDQNKMIVIGNFTSIAGHARRQVAMINLGGTSTALSGWYSARFDLNCSPALPWYFRDADWSADGSWFVIVGTGAASHQPHTLCDSASRWALSIEGNAEPAWVNYTGGDSLHSVKIVGNVVYVGGHQRWLDNPDGTDTKVGAAVDRPGIGAINATSGKALAWNPTRTRGVGAKELYYTNVPGITGLWVGSDTDQLGNEYHASIGFLPTP